MKKIFLPIIILIISISARSIELSDSLKASVITVLPGKELYSTFGHTAIRIKDLKNGNDLVFNYGTFDFQTHNFYLKFVLGKLDYMLSVDYYNDFVADYEYEQRTIIEQELNFDKIKTIRLANLLVNNYRPQNRYYRYKFFTDNCSTRIRDVLAQASGDILLLKKAKSGADKTFRELYTQYLITMPWSKFGIDLLMGKFADKKAGYDALFLPDYLKEAIELASLDNKLLVAEECIVFKSNLHNNKKNIFSPALFVLCLLLSTFFVQLKKKFSIFFDKIYFLIMGLLGAFILFVCIFSAHVELQKNLLVLFFLPSNIILPFLPKTLFRKYYCVCALGLMILGLMFLPFQTQLLSFNIIILIISLMIRLFFNIK